MVLLIRRVAHFSKHIIAIGQEQNILREGLKEPLDVRGFERLGYQEMMTNQT